MAAPYNQSGRSMASFNNMEARVGSGGQILSESMAAAAAAAAATSQSTMHTLQPVVVDSGWPPLMSLDPSTGTVVPSLNAMMMMMMPQMQTTQYPVMFTTNQPVSSADSGFTQMINMPSSIQSVASGHSTIDVRQLHSLQGNTDSWMKPSGPAAVAQTQNSQDQSKVPSPPKRPLSAYMRFSKQVWVDVKAANPGLSVCEIGGIIGRMWRELSEADKKNYSDDFGQEKVKYDGELKAYLQMTGLKSSDLNKPKPKAKKKDQSSSAAKKSEPQPASSPRIDAPVHNGTAASTGQVWSGNQCENISNRLLNPSPVGSTASHVTQHTLPQSSVSGMQANGNGMDSMVVFHMTDDGNSYVERGQTMTEMKSANAPDQRGGSAGRGMGMMESSESGQLASAGKINELMQTINELKTQLANAYRCIDELRQENNLLRQMREAQVPMR